MSFPKIEYKVIPQDGQPTQAWLNREGADGWQMIAVLMNDPAKAAAGYKVIFSRPVNSQPVVQDDLAVIQAAEKAAAEMSIHSSYRSLPK